MSLLESFSVVLTGISVVFLTLILLVLLLTLMGVLSRKSSGGTAGDTATTPDATAQPSSTPASITPQPDVEAGISEEVVAVISATVAAVTAPDASYRVTSIRRNRRNTAGRNAWGKAGVNESTQSF